MNTDNQQPNNPLHGVKLAEILQYLVATYGWEELGATININCLVNIIVWKSKDGKTCINYENGL